MTEETGGSAFPLLDSGNGRAFDDGMSLRDYFAAKALAAMLSNTDKDCANRGKQGLKVFPVYAYEWADALLEARK